MSKVYESTFGAIFLKKQSIYPNINLTNNEVNEILAKECDYTTFELISYQRAYKWSEEMCQLFYNDIIVEKGEGYNFGFITLSTINKTSNKELIDGQQRITSFYLLSLAIYALLIEKNASLVDCEKIKNFLDIDSPNFHFLKSDDSRSIKHIQDLFVDIKNQIDINEKSNIVYNNFKLFKNLLFKIISDDDNIAILTLNKIFNQMIKQKVIILEYDDLSEGLNSFISLNMKSQQLDSFEIISAYILNDIDKNRYKKIKQYLNRIYDDYEDLTSVLKYKKFEDYLKNSMISIEYELYLREPQKINELTFSKLNNYVNKNLLTIENKLTFLKKIHKYNKATSLFLNDGTLNPNIQIDKFNNEDKTAFKQRTEEIDFLLYGWFTSKKENMIIKLSSIPTHLQRYLFAIINKASYTDSTVIFFNCLNEIVLVLILSHLLNVTKYNYDLSRKALSEKLYENTYDLKKLQCDNEDGILCVSNLSDLNLKYKHCNLNIINSLSVIFQVNNLNKEIKKGTKIISVPPIESYNYEHFLIDDSRYKYPRTSKKILHNCIILDTKTNEQFGKNKEYKCLQKKIIFLQSQKSNFKLTNFLIDEFDKLIIKKPDPVFSNLFTDYQTILSKDYYQEIDYYLYIDSVLEVIDKDLVKYINDKSKKIFNYTNTIKVFCR